MSKGVLIFITVFARFVDLMAARELRERREECAGKGGTLVSTDTGRGICAKLKVIKP